MKKLIYGSSIAAVLLLGACGDTETATDSTKKTGTTVETVAKETKEEPKVLAKNTDEVISFLTAEGLELGGISDLGNDEFGNIRIEGKRILIPSLGSDSGGRLFLFDSEENLNTVKKYYDDLGSSGPMFYSHTHQSGLFLLQMNGSMTDDAFAKYAASLDNAVTGTTNIKVAATTENKSTEAPNLTEANIGEVVVDDFAGTYTIEKIYEAPTDKYKSADVEFTIDQIKTAKLVALDSNLIGTAAETSVLILSVTGENLSDDTISFHPNTAKMTTSTKRQIDSNVMISQYESEFIGNVIQKGEVIFDLGEEGLKDVTELKFIFDGPAKDYTTIGEDVTVKITLN